MAASHAQPEQPGRSHIPSSPSAHTRLPQPEADQSAAAPMPESVPTLKELQARTSRLAALHLQVEEEGMRVRQQRLAAAKARIDSQTKIRESIFDR